MAHPANEVINKSFWLVVAPNIKQMGSPDIRDEIKAEELLN
jgi:hypothetical protein